MKDWRVVKLQVEILNPRRDLLHKGRNHPHKGVEETFEKKESSSTLISKHSLSRSGGGRCLFIGLTTKGGRWGEDKGLPPELDWPRSGSTATPGGSTAGGFLKHLTSSSGSTATPGGSTAGWRQYRCGAAGAAARSSREPIWAVPLAVVPLRR